MGKKDLSKKTAIQRVIKNKPKETGKKPSVKRIPMQGKVFVHATFNNTIVTVTDIQGNTISWSSTGKTGFKGSRKSTPFAASKATEEVMQKLYEKGLRSVEMVINGPGMGRDAAVRSVKNSGLKITSIADVTSIPHNGCRPKGRRRV